MKCNKCNKVGHIQRACPSGKFKVNTVEKQSYRDTKKGNVHVMTDKSDEDSDTGITSLEIYNVSDESPDESGETTEPIWLKPQVNGKTIILELDTGSAYSVMSQSEFERQLKHVKLCHTKKILKTYTGERIMPVGAARVKVEYNNQKCMLNLYVVKTHGPALWGRAWLSKICLDWIAIKSL